MGQRKGGLLRKRIVITVVLVVLVMTVGGAAYSFKKSYVPGPVSGMQVNGEPLQGYGSHAGEGIEELEPCGACHPTGEEGEAREAGYGS